MGRELEEAVQESGSNAGVSRITVPPGPGLIRRIVDTYWLWNDPWNLHLRYAARYGDIVRFGRKLIFLNDPQLIRDMLVTDAPNHHRIGGNLKSLQGEGLVASNGELHAQQRQLIEPSFHHSQIMQYADCMVTWTDRICSRWQPQQIVDVHEQMMRLTLGIVCEALFGIDIEKDGSSLAESLERLMAAFPMLFVPFRKHLERLPIPPLRRLKRSMEEFDRLLYRLIETRRAGGAGGNDLLSLFLRAQASGVGCVTTDQQVRDQCTTLLTAGHETTASALTFTLYLLAHNPSVADRLAQEIADTIGTRQPEASDFRRLSYVRMVFAEAMRLYPPIWSSSRVVKHSYSIRGYTVTPGTILEVCQYSVHRDPRFFPQPHRFLPERFAPANEASRPKFSYFPFGAGPRHCIGENFAWTEGVLLIARIMQKWRLELVSDSHIRLQPGISLRPKRPVLVRLIPVLS